MLELPRMTPGRYTPRVMNLSASSCQGHGPFKSFKAAGKPASTPDPPEEIFTTNDRHPQVFPHSSVGAVNLAAIQCTQEQPIWISPSLDFVFGLCSPLLSPPPSARSLSLQRPMDADDLNASGGAYTVSNTVGATVSF